ncbi:MAG: hypothetical protein ACJAX4_002886 [Clostridium sp.]|jgi:hypothetical protein
MIITININIINIKFLSYLLYIMIFNKVPICKHFLKCVYTIDTI